MSRQLRIALTAATIGLGLLAQPVAALADESGAGQATSPAQQQDSAYLLQEDDDAEQVSGDFGYKVDKGMAVITSYRGQQADVVIPSSLDGYPVSAVGESLFGSKRPFKGNTKLRSITFPNSLQSIGAAAFAGCSNLASITLPERLQSIDYRAFANCARLSSITVNSRSLSMAHSSGSFQNAGISGPGITVTFGTTCNKVPDRFFAYDNGEVPYVKRVVISPSVTTIESSAFFRIPTIEEVDIQGAGLKKIESEAFSGASSLKSIVLPQSLSRLGFDVFKNCTSLESVRVECKTLSMHSSGAFANAGIAGPGIDVTFGSQCTEVPRGLLHTNESGQAPNIKSIRIPAAVTKIGTDAFGDAYGYTIYGYAGTVAFTYARDHNIPFVSLGSAVSFSDVNAGSWYYSAVMYAAENGLITGYGNNVFGPDDTLTRAQAAVILYRYLGAGSSQSSYNTTGMSDVMSNTYYTEAANWAVKNKVINGVSRNGRTYFEPEGPITREQLCAIMANAAKRFNGADPSGASLSALSSMPDAGQVSDWSRQSVAWGLSTGLISGANENGIRYIRPQQTVDRATMAAIMMNAISKGIISR